MEEIRPGLWHWVAEHPKIHIPVSSHYFSDAATLFDPLPPPDAAGWFDDHPVERIVLSNRHHLRGAPELAQQLGATIHAPAAGMHEFEGSDVDVRPYEPGDELAPGVRAVEFGVLSPDDGALHIACGEGALLIADALVNYGGIGFVPDEYLADPEADKAATYERLPKLLELEFDALLFAHGEPIATGGHAALERFAESR
jgi:glyoxylase-like metal-dependent hydrolase (beta-lactamase superfamily II)